MSRISDLLEKVGGPQPQRRDLPPPRPVSAAAQRPTHLTTSPRPEPESVMTLRARDLVVPAYGFDTSALAERYLSEVGWTLDDRRRTVIRSGGKVYVERGITMAEDSMDLDPLGDRRGVSDPRYRQPWLTLLSADKPKPHGAYHVLLLPEGRRETSWFGDRKRAAPWVTSARTGPWDVAVAWQRGDGEDLRPVYERDGLRVYAARNVRGVLIARRAVISPGGAVERYVTETRFMTLDVFDRTFGTDDKVRPWFSVSVQLDEGPTDPLTYLDRFDEERRPLFERAAGCSTCTAPAASPRCSRSACASSTSRARSRAAARATPSARGSRSSTGSPGPTWSRSPGRWPSRSGSTPAGSAAR